MANDRLSNIAGLFREGKTRTIILTTVFVLLVAVVIGFLSIRGRVKGVEAAAGVSSAPGNIQSIPFNAPNEEYARLQEQQNTQEAKKAEKTGESAIPTIIRAGNDKGPEPAAVSDTGLGFSGLSREESDAGTFNPKVFGAGSTCPLDQIQKVVQLCRSVPGVVAGQGASLGTPVYDKNGRLIGYADANGKVRDLNGNVIGTMGPDGVVRDLNGNTIGETSHSPLGTPIYDTKTCSLLGRVGSDGQVRDASGKTAGILGSDGILHDAEGKTLGQAGTPAYTPDGKLIGFSCTDGKVRDANGNIIGTVGSDGTVRDLNGNVIGRVGVVPPGTAVYGPDGKLLGYLGPDGKIRDANGTVVGTMGVDGVAKDLNGNPMGSVAKPAAQAAQPTEEAAGNNANTAEKNNTEQRRVFISGDQNSQQALSQAQQSMTTQANQLFAAWAPPSQQLIQGDVTPQNQANNSGYNSGNNNSGAGVSSGSSSGGTVFIKAGTVYYGVIDTAVNSDEPGPIMATVVSGPYKGGKLLGSLTNQKQAVMLSFNLLTLNNYPKSIAVNVVAIDQNTARTGLSTETDNHYLYRYGSVFAAAFIQGYGQAFQTSGSTITSNGLSTQSSTPDLSPVGKFFVALGNVGQQFNTSAQLAFTTPPTVHVASGTPVGLLFLTDAQLAN